MPTIWSRSSPITGKREWPDSITAGSSCCGPESRSSTTICDRGTMMSRTCWSPTRSTPWIICMASASTMPPRAAARIASTSSARSRGPSFVRRRSQPLPFPLAANSASVRIRDADAREQPPLAAFHALRVPCAQVVEADQVQRPVHDHVGPVRGERLALLARLARDDRRADHDVADLPAAELRRRGKRQNVRRARAAAPALVELPALALADDADAELALVVPGCEPRPAAKRRGSRRPGPARAIAQHDVQAHLFPSGGESRS